MADRRSKKVKPGLRTRDFIYMDVDRVRSVYSQVEEGLLETRSAELGKDREVSGGAGVKLPWFASGEAKASLLWRDTTTETTSLHDHMFNFLEDRLLESGDLLDLEANYPDGTWLRDDFAETVSPTAFVRIHGPVRINDYSNMSALLAEMPRLTKALAEVVVPIDGMDPDKRKKAISAMVADMGMPPKSWIDQLLFLLKELFGDTVVMKCRPFGDCAFIAKVNPVWLRDDIRSLLFRFGALPSDPWTIVGQIARVARVDDSTADDSNASGDNIEASNEVGETRPEDAFEGAFNAVNGLQEFASLSYPDVAITPFAVYRG
jgi:hypothetical protein